MNENLKKSKIQKGGDYKTVFGKVLASPVQGAVRMGKGLALRPMFNMAKDVVASTDEIRKTVKEGQEEMLSPLQKIVSEQIGEETEEEYAARSGNQGLSGDSELG